MNSTPLERSIPIVDVAALVGGGGSREHGFFYVTGHGVPEELQTKLERLSHAFFARSLEEKRAAAPIEDREVRWDASVHDVVGTYGDYLLAKVAKVFPQLKGRAK